MAEKIPKAVSESELNIGGVVLKVVVLDDGRRLIASESMAKFFAALQSGEIMITEKDAAKIGEFVVR